MSSSLTVEPSNIRKIAERRQHALSDGPKGDAAVAHVSAGVFWVIWRDGVNWGLTSSGKLSTLFYEVGEHILLMSQARDAVPPFCPHCGETLE